MYQESNKSDDKAENQRKGIETERDVNLKITGIYPFPEND